MSSKSGRVELPASHKPPPRGATPVGSADPEARFQVTLRLRPRHALPPADELGAREVRERRYLTREEFASAYGADAHDIAKVEEFASRHGLDVVEVGVGRRTVILSGTTLHMQEAFGVQLLRYEEGKRHFRGRSGAVSIPENLSGVVTAVFGLDDRAQASPYARFPREARALGGAGAFKPTELAKLYSFPENADGSGQCIALIELGGGFRAEELQTYFKGLGLATMPTVTAISVNGGHNSPGTDASADSEVLLDIEVAGAVAPGAQLAVYFAPNTDAGFLNAVNAALHDANRKPSVISISWGGAEFRWTQQAATAMDEAFQAAAAMGVTILAAAGDNGSSDGARDGKVHVDFPASSPHVTACGGTRLVAQGAEITEETVWNEDAAQSATGGGVSDLFPLPDWQKDVKVPVQKDTGKPGRGLPDVAAVADPLTGYRVLVNGQDTVIGGTSAVAPLYAGLIARINQAKGRPVGFLNPRLYLKGGALFRDITQGNNGRYEAGQGWDTCTGWGSPHGTKLLGGL